jgi:hypothetical protein
MQNFGKDLIMFTFWQFKGENKWHIFLKKHLIHLVNTY